jgi:hypothetical protein
MGCRLAGIWRDRLPDARYRRAALPPQAVHYGDRYYDHPDTHARRETSLRMVTHPHARKRASTKARARARA